MTKLAFAGKLDWHPLAALTPFPEVKRAAQIEGEPARFGIRSTPITMLAGVQLDAGGMIWWQNRIQSAGVSQVLIDLRHESLRQHH